MRDVGCDGGFTIRRLLKAASKRGKSQTRLSVAGREQARAKVYGAQGCGIDISEESVAKAKKVNAKVLDKQVFVTQGSAEKLPYEDGKFDLVTAVETVYFWPTVRNQRMPRLLA